MQAQNDLAVSSCWWYCGGLKDLQGLRSEKSRYFPQHDLSEQRSSSSSMLWSVSGFICKTEAWMAMARTDSQDQHPVLGCLAAFKGQAMRGRVNSKGSQAGRKAVGKERGLIYERRGCISIQPERDPCKCSLCGTHYRHYIVGQRSTEKFHVSQKYSQRSLFPSNHVTEAPIVPASRKLCVHQKAEDDWSRRGFQK